MSSHHSWRECRPVILDFGDKSPDPAMLALAWAIVSDEDRLLFHEFCCLNNHDSEHEAAIQRISSLVGALI